MSNNELIPAGLLGPGTLTTTDKQFDDSAKGASFLKQIKLYSSGKAVNRKLVGGGHWGVYISEDKIQDLGDSIDVIVLARRLKAMQFGAGENDRPISNYDRESDTFKEIESKSEDKDSGCVWGISFLVVERQTGEMFEVYFSTKSSRPEARNVYPFVFKEGLPLKACTLNSKYVEKGDYSWFAPQVLPCTTPFANMPSPEAMKKEYDKFLSPKSEEVTKSEGNTRAR